MKKNIGFLRYFTPQKKWNKENKEVFVKHSERERLIWDSSKKGTYIRAKHGELPRK